MSFGAIKLGTPREPSVIAPKLDATARQTDDLELLARWMDTAFEVPGLPVRFGLDALLGLIPGIGDAAGSFVSLYILQKAHGLGLPRATLLRMALNVAIDAIVGAVPLAGDAFDVYWKANRRNVDLVRRHVAAAPVDVKLLRRRDRLFVVIAMVVILGLIAASAAATIYLVGWAWGLIRQVLA